MSTQAALDFMKKTATDAALAARVTEATSGKSGYESAAAVAALGKANGCDFTPAEGADAFRLAVDHLRKEGMITDELSEESLDKVAGGAIPTGGRAVTTDTAALAAGASPGGISSIINSLQATPAQIDADLSKSALNVITTISDPNNPNSPTYKDTTSLFNAIANIIPATNARLNAGG